MPEALVAPPALRLLPISDFLDTPDPEVPWIVEGLLPAGGTSLLSAKPRAGKSTFVRSLLVSVAKGDRFLNKSTSQVPVFYIGLEEISSFVKKDLVAMGVSRSDPIHVHTGDINRDTSTSELTSAIAAARPGLVILDTIGKFLPIQDFNDYGDVNSKMYAVTSMLRQFPETHVMFVHHSTKTEREDDYLGSVAFHGNVDVFFRMFRNGDRHFIQARQQRYGIDLPQTELGISSVTNRVIIGSGGGAGERPAAPGDRSDESLISAIIGAIQGGLTSWRAIRDSVGGRASRLQTLRNDLLIKGILVLNDDNTLSLPPTTSPPSAA